MDLSAINQAYVPRGIPELKLILTKTHEAFIKYDPDIDGTVAGEFMRRFLHRFGIPYTYGINDNRQHGLKMSDDVLLPLKGKTIFLVDAGTSLEELRHVTSLGINIVNIDHHHIDHQDLVFFQNTETGAYALMINNQYPFEPEALRFLSGAGVVYYTLEALVPGFCTLDEAALVGLTLLSDIRPLESKLAQEFLTITYMHDSPQMSYLLKCTRPDRDWGFGEQTFDRNYIDYTFSPKINALFRLNKGHAAIDLFRGAFKIQPQQLDEFRRVQNSIRDLIIQNLKGVELSNLIFKGVGSHVRSVYQYDITNFIGLACSRLSNGQKTAFLYVEENGKIKRGSVRGKCDDVDYLSIFRKYGFQAEGHHNAFGVISVDLPRVDIVALNAEIAQHEQGYEGRKYVGRLFPVSNLSMFMSTPRGKKIAEMNNYLRDSQRIYLEYKGTPQAVEQRGKMTAYLVDGIEVRSFEPGLAFEDGLILPVNERRKYIYYYLKPR